MRALLTAATFANFRFLLAIFFLLALPFLSAFLFFRVLPALPGHLRLWVLDISVRIGFVALERVVRVFLLLTLAPNGWSTIAMIVGCRGPEKSVVHEDVKLLRNLEWQSHEAATARKSSALVGIYAFCNAVEYPWCSRIQPPSRSRQRPSHDLPTSSSRTR